MPTRRNQTEHDIMVRSVARYAKEQGHTDIKVNLFGFDTPDQMYWATSKLGHTPDITSTNIKHFIIDVVTVDSINDPETEERWKLFAANAKQQSNAFVVAVPKGFEQQARDKAKALGVKLETVWAVE